VKFYRRVSPRPLRRGEPRLIRVIQSELAVGFDQGGKRSDLTVNGKRCSSRSAPPPTAVAEPTCPAASGTTRQKSSMRREKR
jgi:hypothetical protein